MIGRSPLSAKETLRNSTRAGRSFSIITKARRVYQKPWEADTNLECADLGGALVFSTIQSGVAPSLPPHSKLSPLDDKVSRQAQRIMSQIVHIHAREILDSRGN